MGGKLVVVLMFLEIDKGVQYMHILLPYVFLYKIDTKII